MKVCIIGKYPPIEGGVSASTYWLAHGLAQRGHQIYVVTNATEVEQPYRIYLSKNDENWYEPTFSSGGFVRVLCPESMSLVRMKHIPLANPFVSKLAGLATQTVREYGCDLIFCYYYEPYAMAGFLASVWTGLPLVVKHAGSDLDRLMTVPDLAVSYKEMLRAADGVVTRGGLRARFRGMGVKEERIVPDVPFTVPTHVFSPDAPPLPIDSLMEEFADNKFQPSTHAFDPTKPTIGIYGKIGTAKGSYDLIHALAILKNEGLQFNLLAMTQGSQIEQFRQVISDCGLDDMVQILPFLPHWRVPGFIRTCTAVCFLERDFPIAIHGPIIPLEVMSCGTCLILSQEIASKQHYRDEIRDGENVLIVADPKDHHALATQLRLVITQPDRAARIGMQGRQLTSHLADFSTYIDGYEAMFHRFVQNNSREKLPQEDQIDLSVATRIEWFAPVTKLLLGIQFENIVARFMEQRDETRVTDGALSLEFCGFVENMLDSVFQVQEMQIVREILKYQRLMTINCFEEQSRIVRAYAGTNVLGDNVINWKNVEQLKPLRGNQVQVAEFEYDITPIFTDTQLEAENTPIQEMLSRLVKQKTFVCFALSPNLAHYELKISPIIRTLLDACNGNHTTATIVQQLVISHGLKTENDVAAFRKNILGAFQQLYAKKIIVFIK